MKLKLSRQECGKKSTLGSLTINGVHETWIIEDQDRQLEVNPDAKVYGETCIPRGIYDVIITYSNRFKTPLPLLVGVKEFEGVRIHPGNTSEDTHGCLLPATKWARDAEGNAVGLNSREAFRRLFAKIEAAVDNNEPISIEIL